MFGCLTRILAGVVLLVLLVFAWIFREPILQRLDRGIGRETPEAAPSSLVLADTATAKLERLAGATTAQTVALSEQEVQALVENRLGPYLPEYVLDPAIELDGDHAVLSGRVPTDRIPKLEDELGAAAGLLPDTTEITATGQLIPLDSRHIALAIDKMTVARIPLPRRMIPRVVSRLRRVDAEGAPDDAFPLPLPPRVSGAYIRNDSLVLVGRPARAKTAR